jgi:putative acetyltransferase
VNGWFALGPISVEPGRQRTGFGSALIEAAKTWMRGQDAQGCILTGNPRYYERFGWAVSPDHAPKNEPAQFFQILRLGGEPPPGRFAFHPAFYG